MKGTLHHSGSKYRILKKQQFTHALQALDRLEEGSIRLPESVCRRIWQAVHEVKQARLDWMIQHQDTVHIVPGHSTKLTSREIIRDAFLGMMELSREDSAPSPKISSNRKKNQKSRKKSTKMKNSFQWNQ